MKNPSLLTKANSVICSCKTPAQLRVATKYAYLALGAIGKTVSEKQFEDVHFSLQQLLNAKARQIKARARRWFF